MDYNYYIFYFTLIITWTLIISLFFGIANIKYLDEATYYIRLYICLFLILRFNPFLPLGGKKFTDLDAKISYSAAIAILTSQTEFIVYSKKLFEKLKSYL